MPLPAAKAEPRGDFFLPKAALARLGRDALARSEERHRAIVDSLAQIIWCTGCSGIPEQSPYWLEYTGQTAEEAHGWGWTRALHPDDRATASKVWNASVASFQPFNTKYRIRRADGVYRWFLVKGTPIFSSEGQVKEWVGVCIDIDDSVKLQQSMEHQQLLLRELDHRVKNTLSVVQALSRQIIRNINTGSDTEDELMAFEQRLMALAITHNLLTQSNWEGTTLRELIEVEAKPYTDSQIDMQGPDIDLSSRTTISLGLVFHELLTNAAKYGALSTPDGVVRLSWTTMLDPQNQTVVHLHWKETGGPAVKMPSSTGFGSKLLSRMIKHDLSGQLTTHFHASGFEAEMVVVLEF